MKTYAVSIINFMDNDLKITFEKALTPELAVKQALISVTDEGDTKEWAEKLPDTMEELKVEVFNCDMMVDAKELPE